MASATIETTRQLPERSRPSGNSRSRSTIGRSSTDPTRVKNQNAGAAHHASRSVYQARFTAAEASPSTTQSVPNPVSTTAIGCHGSRHINSAPGTSMATPGSTPDQPDDIGGSGCSGSTRRSIAIAAIAATAATTSATTVAMRLEASVIRSSSQARCPAVTGHESRVRVRARRPRGIRPAAHA
jgi:hypothetical protein